jgi:hypothetical protein
MQVLCAPLSLKTLESYPRALHPHTSARRRTRETSKSRHTTALLTKSLLEPKVRRVERPKARPLIALHNRRVEVRLRQKDNGPDVTRSPASENKENTPPAARGKEDIRIHDHVFSSCGKAPRRFEKCKRPSSASTCYKSLCG